MRDKYSRKELQGWGDIKGTVLKQEVFFDNVEVSDEIYDKYVDFIAEQVEFILVGLSYISKKSINYESDEDINISGIYDDLEDAGLKYISYLNEKKQNIEWDKILKDVLEKVKRFLIKNYADDLLKKFSARISSVVYNYTMHLPKHVLSSEFDDLANIARIEFIETIKAWDPYFKGEIWSLAYSRITGAMKDHLRYLTKADPGRMFEWINNAAYVFMTVNGSENMQTKIENQVQLAEALKSLSYTEQTIVNNRYKNDKTFKEIGEIVNLSESQVTRVYKEAVTKIKKILGTDIN